MKVKKKSRKPFKSGEKIGTVVGVTINPHSGKEAYIMDDGSVVDTFQCEEHENE